VNFALGARQVLDGYQAHGTPIVASAELGCAPQVAADVNVTLAPVIQL
jgi:hypothetical protein